MAFNLLDTLRGYLTPNLVERASSYLGESTTSINKGLTAAVPSVLGMFVNRAEKGDSQGLLSDAFEAADSNVLTNPQSLFSGDKSSSGGGLSRLENVLGGNVSHIISSITNFAGIKSSAVQGLMALIAPLGLGVLGRHARESNLSAQGLTSFLTGQKSSITNALPSGFSLGNLFEDRTNIGRTTTTVRDRDTVRETPRAAHMQPVADRRGGSRIMPWLLLGLGAIALIWLLGRNRTGTHRNETAQTHITTTEDHAAKAPVATPAPAPAPAAPATTVITRTSTKVRLANGTELNAYRGGVEERLVTCLNDAGCVAGKDKWFDFDNINFEVGSARLTDASQDQVKNIVAILKAYPNAKIKIGGYTDKTGNAVANKSLSQQRADAVKNAIKTAGANEKQLVGSEGFGSEFAKVPASASDEERMTDRRISIQLRGK